MAGGVAAEVLAAARAAGEMEVGRAAATVGEERAVVARLEAVNWGEMSEAGRLGF